MITPLPEDPDRLRASGTWKGYFRWVWLLWLARLRLSHYAVCTMSQGRGLSDDFHDYRDTKDKFPDHFAELVCERCGKKFMI